MLTIWSLFVHLKSIFYIYIFCTAIEIKQAIKHKVNHTCETFLPDKPYFNRFKLNNSGPGVCVCECAACVYWHFCRFSLCSIFMIIVRLERPHRPICYTYTIRNYYVLFLCRDWFFFVDRLIFLLRYGCLYQLHQAFQIVRLHIMLTLRPQTKRQPQRFDNKHLKSIRVENVTLPSKSIKF